MGGEDCILTSLEQEILDLLLIDKLTIKQIAIARGKSTQAIYKIKNKLVRKGVLNRSFTRRLQKTQSSHFQNLKTSSKYCRLHGQEWNIKIIYKTDYYDAYRKQKNLFYIDGNPIRLYEDSIEVYSNPLLDFRGDDAQRTYSLSLNYWNKIWSRLENRLKIIIIKEENTKIKEVNKHFAEVNNEMAKDCNDKKIGIKVYGTKDGKAWFTIDKSWNIDEAECIHPEQSKQDYQKVIKGYLNDIRDNVHNLPSQNKAILDTLLFTINELASAQLNTQNQLTTLFNIILPQTQSEVKNDKTKPDYFG